MLGSSDLTRRKLLRFSQTDTGADVAIPLPNVSGKDLAKVIEYCKFKADSKKKNADGEIISEEDVKNWENEFVKVDQGTLFQLILVRFKFFSSFSLSSFPCRLRWVLFPQNLLTYVCRSIVQPPQAANYLNIKELLDLTCFTVASMIRGKSPEEIRKAFNIKVRKGLFFGG